MMSSSLTVILSKAIYCPRCKKRHIDENEWAHKPHHTHLCVDDGAGKGCAHEFRVSDDANNYYRGAWVEAEKLSSYKDKSDHISEFLDWLRTKYAIAEYVSVTPNSRTKELRHASISMERLLADFFDIDLVELDKEKREMLDGLRTRFPAPGKKS